MSTAVKAVFENGALKLKEPTELGRTGEVEIRIPTPAEQESDPTGWKTMDSFIGLWEGEPEGSAVSEDPDRYLYD